MDSLSLFLLDQGFRVEYELDEFNTPYTGTTLRHPQNWLCRLRCRIPLLFHLWPTFSGDIHASPRNNQNHKLTVTSTFLSSNSKHDFCYTMANISPSHVQQLAQLSPLYNKLHFVSLLLSLLRDLQHKRKLFIPCCH